MSRLNDNWQVTNACSYFAKKHADDEALRELSKNDVFFAMSLRKQIKFHVKLRMLVNIQSLLAVLACFLKQIFSVYYF